MKNNNYFINKMPNYSVNLISNIVRNGYEFKGYVKNSLDLIYQNNFNDIFIVYNNKLTSKKAQNILDNPKLRNCVSISKDKYNFESLKLGKFLQAVQTKIKSQDKSLGM